MYLNFGVHFFQLTSKSGSLVWKKEDFGGRGVAIFSPDEKFITLTSANKKEINLIEISSGKIVWSYGYDSDNKLKKYLRLGSVDVSDSGEFTVFSNFLVVNIGEGVIDNSNAPRWVYLINKDGKEIWKEKFYADPKVNISPDGHYIKITTEDGFWVYSNKYAE